MTGMPLLRESMMCNSKSEKMIRLTQLPKVALLLAVVALTACSNGGSNTENRTENTLPSFQLSDGDVLGNGNNVVRIPASDDTGIASVNA